MRVSDLTKCGYQAFTIQEMAKEINEILPSVETRDAEFILTEMIAYFKREMLKCNEIRIPKIGKFRQRLRPATTRKNIFGKLQTKPEMYEAFFETNKTLRRFINKAKR